MYLYYIDQGRCNSSEQRKGSCTGVGDSVGRREARQYLDMGGQFPGLQTHTVHLRSNKLSEIGQGRTGRAQSLSDELKETGLRGLAV